MEKNRKILEAIKNHSLESKTISFATVSGIVTTNPGMIRRIDALPDFTLITTKSYQVNPNPGNREPVIVEPGNGSFGNAVGLRNPGMIKGLEELKKLTSRETLTSILNISVSGNSVEEFITLIRHFEGIADIIELNLSCPHAAKGYGMAIGTDPEVVYSYLSELRKVTDALIFPKLTPNVDSISEIAIAAVQGGADGITAINTAGPRLYVEPVSGEPLLLNNSGNKGGMSGKWIKDLAVKKVSEIREALGPDVPIIGMGGIETGEDVRNMMRAGADIVGIGSLFASIHPDDWNSFFPALKNDAVNNSDTASVYRNTNKKMEYVPHTLTGITDLPGDARVLELDGEISFKAGQFVFLYIPGTGEKPFAVMKGSPPSFLVKKKGIFTSKVMELEIGMQIFSRGVYGKDSPDTDKRKVLISAGGTGLATALKLAEKLKGEGKEIHTYYGMGIPGQEVMEDDFLHYGTFTAVADNGIPGRVIDTMISELDKNSPVEDCALYTIGPDPFMEKTAEDFIKAGGRAEEIFLSLETPTRCGVGLCGECECGGHLTCREGTFFSYAYLQDIDHED